MVPEEITPLVPAVVGEKVADDQTCFILETLLKYMVIQVRNVHVKRMSRLRHCFSVIVRTGLNFEQKLSSI